MAVNDQCLMFLNFLVTRDRAEQRLRMCKNEGGLEAELVQFAKGFSKHSHILPILRWFPNIRGSHFNLR